MRAQRHLQEDWSPQSLSLRLQILSHGLATLVEHRSPHVPVAARLVDEVWEDLLELCSDGVALEGR